MKEGRSSDLPEHLAQYVIARAIELDTDGQSRMPLARLREIAFEAGISAESLERALRETLSGTQQRVAVRKPRTGYLHRLGQRIVGSAIAEEAAPELWSPRGTLEGVATNLLAFAAFWVPSLLTLSFLHSLGLFLSGVSSTASVLVATLIGIAIARRFQARATMIVLSLCAVAMMVSVISQLTKVSSTVGFFGSSAFQWLLAGSIGVGVGILLARWRKGGEGDDPHAHLIEGDDFLKISPRDEPSSPRKPFLMVRLSEVRGR